MADTITTSNGSVTFANPKIFNNEENSDIIIEFSGQKIYAHRIILRMWSPFFERALTSKFAVAQNQVFSLGDDDNPEAIWAMLRHMYNFEYSSGKDLNTEDSPDYHVDVYEVADKYDCPILRQKTAQGFIKSLKSLITKGSFEKAVPVIKRTCGPDASHPTNSKIRSLVAKFCFFKFESLLETLPFTEALTGGTLFDATMTAQFLVVSLSRYADICAGQWCSGKPKRVPRTPACVSLHKAAHDLEGPENPFADVWK